MDMERFREFENQDTFLDLGNCGIVDLNDLPELFECIHLETLILSNIWFGFWDRNVTYSQNLGKKNNIFSIPQRGVRSSRLSVILLIKNVKNCGSCT